MKKLLASLFIFGALFIGVQQVDASALSDALLKIQNLTKELTQLRSSLKGTVADANLPSITNVVSTPSWASLDIRFSVSSPVTVTEVGYCLKKTSDSAPCVRNIIRGLSSYSDARINLASIEPTTNYTYYLYAKNSYGESKSSDINFTSLVVPFEAYVTTPIAYFPPVVQVYPAPPGLTSSTAVVGGYVTNLGSTGAVSERGACYGSSSSSTPSCMTAYLVQGPGDMFATKFVGLTPDTTYYYRVYAKNSSETVYSAVNTFKTLAGTADLTPINGAWSSWTNSGSCTNNLQTQTRTCTNPVPLNGGTTCSGVSSQQISCSSPVNGGWTSWTNSGGCLNNLQIQTRTCTNPSPANGGTICSGNLAQQISCGSSSLPNLQSYRVDNIPVSVTPTYALGSSITFNGTVVNTGTSSTLTSFNNHFELKSSLNSSVSVINLPSVISSAVSSGSSTKVSSSLNLTTPANYSVRLCADQTSSTNTGGSVSESNESDNCGDWANFIVNDSSSSTCTILSFDSYPTVMLSGDFSSIKWTTKNCTTAAITTSTGESLGGVPVNGSKTVYPKVDTKYNLMATDGTNQRNASATVMVEADPSIPSITILSPNGREVIDSKKNYVVKWDTKGLKPDTMVGIALRNYENSTYADNNDSTHYFSTTIQNSIRADAGKMSIIFGENPQIAPLIKDGYKFDNVKLEIFTWTPYFEASDLSDEPFKINLLNDSGCSNGQIYSSTTGQKCPGVSEPLVKVIYPNGGETINIANPLTVTFKTKNASPIENYVNIVDASSDHAYRLGSVSYTKDQLIKNEVNNVTFSIPLDFNLKLTNKYKVQVCSGDECYSSSDYFRIINESAVDITCTGNAIFSSMTGKRCSEVVEIRDNGCIAGQNYSSTTGKPCANGLYKNDDSNFGNGIMNTARITRTLKRGITGEDVKRLQKFLQIYADGVYGRGTDAKVKEWQMKNGLYPDGSFGRMSRIKAGLE